MYLTVYSGNKLPPFYIGSTFLDKIEDGYIGSVTSKTYAQIWKSEKRVSRHLFKTYVIAVFDTREAALNKEEKLQRFVKAAHNPLYINQAYANGGFIPPSMNADIAKKISLSKTGKKTGARSADVKRRISMALLGKKKSIHLFFAGTIILKFFCKNILSAWGILFRRLITWVLLKI